MRTWFFALCLLLLAGLTAIAPTVASAQAPAPAPDAAAASAATPTAAEQAQALAEALKDPIVREALIRELERAGAPAAEAEDGPRAPDAETAPVSFGRRIAEATQGAAEGIAGGVTQFLRGLASAPAVFANFSGAEVAVLYEALLELALIIAITVSAFFVLRTVGKRFDRRMGARAEAVGLLRTSVLVLASFSADVLVVLGAWALGYLLAVAAIGEFGQIGIRQTLYLNAFLVVECVKVGLCLVLSPTTTALRPIAIPDRAAKILNIWLSVVVSLLGYGQLLVVPIVAQHVSWSAGQSVDVVISMLAVLTLAALVLSSRKSVSRWLLEDRNMAQGAGLYQTMGRYWHVPVLLYLLALLSIVAARPDGVLLPVLGASLQIVGAIVFGSIVVTGISRSIQRGVHLPENVARRLPALETRLNRLAPLALSGIRLLILTCVLLFALHTIGAIDMRSWLESQVGVTVTGRLISVALLLAGAILVWLAVSSWIDYRLNPDFGSVPSTREQTLLALARNALTIAMIAITLMFVLSELGVDIAPLIASAGVIGLAIGFGAQKLVQDIITGIFIQFENAMNVGDIVTTGGTTGTVERLTIRSVSLRDLHGAFHIIPFSSVDQVTNFNRGFGQYVCDMGIAYRENIDEAKQAMFDAFEELRAQPEWAPDILEDMMWFGVVQFGDNAVVLRSRIKCVAGKQFPIGRAYNAILKRIFDERGIEIPFPHRTIYFGEDKNGNAPAGRLAITRADRAPAKPKPDDGTEAAGR